MNLLEFFFSLQFYHFQMINNTKEYMSDRLVRPVLKRADSVKQIGNAVLDSRVSVYAADRIEDALDAADKYVDKYLPTEESQDQVDGMTNNKNQSAEIAFIFCNDTFYFFEKG